MHCPVSLPARYGITVTRPWQLFNEASRGFEMLPATGPWSVWTKGLPGLTRCRGGGGVPTIPPKWLVLYFVLWTQGKTCLLVPGKSLNNVTHCVFIFTIFLKEINIILHCLMLNSQGRQEDDIRDIHCLQHVAFQDLWVKMRVCINSRLKPHQLPRTFFELNPLNHCCVPGRLKFSFLLLCFAV